MMDKLIKIGGLCGALLTIFGVIGGVAVAIGYKSDRPAWNSEVEEVASKAVRSLESTFAIRQQIINDARDKFMEENPGKPLPKWIKDRQRRLDEDKQNAIKELLNRK